MKTKKTRMYKFENDVNAKASIECMNKRIIDITKTTIIYIII